MAAPVNLHELANIPGFGAAKRALQKAGHWNAHAGEGPERVFIVTLSAMAPVKAVVRVTARSAAEAEDKAHQMADDGRVCWNDDGDAQDIDAEEIEEAPDA